MERAEQIKKIFADALEIPPSEREKFLAQICGGDAALKNEIESLLGFDERAGDFLQTPVFDVSAGGIFRQIASEESSIIGENIGAYRIVREIGRGGMGMVFLAERADGQFKKKVAVKLLQRTADNGEIVRRFQNERQILADLEHPSIARLIDAGVSRSRLPYFVMEHIKGVQVDRFCEEQNLSIQERLKLFREICAVVAFAHERSTIHRDIKPSNILVTRDGSPKLLDFGIAKVLSSDQFVNNETTAAAFRLMTLDYASPEQVRGERVGYATDVYSLGVLLYKLLTGNLPYQIIAKSSYQIAHSICEDAPARLLISNGRETQITGSKERNEFSDSKVLNRDLNNIIQKALRKEPGKRYASVKEFSDDVARFLDGFPVSARRDTIFYRGAKFLRRQATAVSATLAVAFVFFLVGFSLNMFGNRGAAKETTAANSAKEIYRDLPIERKRGGTDNSEARSLYLRAQVLWEQRTLVSIKSAAELFRQATEKDPEFALAYSGLSNTYFLLSVWGDIPPKEIFPKAKTASLKAIETAPESAEGHLSLAMVYWLYEYDWQSADREFKTAIELNSDYARAPHWYSLFLAEMGRFDEAVAAANRALELESQSIPVNADLARVLFYARRFDESLVQYRKTLEMSPKFEAFYVELFELFEITGIPNNWIDLLEKTNYFDKSSLRKAFQAGDIKGYLFRTLEIYKNPAPSDKHYHFSQAMFYARINDNDHAFESLEKAFAARDHCMAQIKVHPLMDNLRSDPRFSALLRRMNFED